MRSVAPPGAYGRISLTGRSGQPAPARRPGWTRPRPASLPPGPRTRDDACSPPRSFFCRLCRCPVAGCVRSARCRQFEGSIGARCKPAWLCARAYCLHRAILGAIARQDKAATCKSTGGTLAMASLMLRCLCLLGLLDVVGAPNQRRLSQPSRLNFIVPFPAGGPADTFPPRARRQDVERCWGSPW